MSTILILGGTEEGYTLAKALSWRFRERLRIIISLVKERSSWPLWQGLCWRAGPFCGVEDLTAYLRRECVIAVLVATHPFATTIAHNARLACDVCGVPRLTLSRPLWKRMPNDIWIEVDNMVEAANRLPDLGLRAFLTVGTRMLPAFSTSRGVWFLVRLPSWQISLSLPYHEPPHCFVIDSGCSSNALSLMRMHAIDMLVTKASGGTATENKIIAARMLGLPVLMVRRPPAEPGESVATVAEAVVWVEEVMCRRFTRFNIASFYT